ncbi:unnamed protein product [Didymodactylos carnosus]|uniref:Uncharacterized protein n=1 Tax=Didymodactylos carnosus TaxID=1234261 RepID=A0A815N5X4_9BILA|nr:unnamed protein product [Didymodactylos carnosus]CAF1433801.1 unnamed protein product [Didymodactylos carnosus]CAF4069027.1 unnamed protein product [Didymodactylos carnosus]CAF4311724.1 unnamed protein product [Didymodactylos carnosus]
MEHWAVVNNQSIPREAVPLSPNSCLPDVLRKTDRGEDFVLYKSNHMIIFTCKSNSDVLKSCNHWFADGTFSVRFG